MEKNTRNLLSLMLKSTPSHSGSYHILDGGDFLKPLVIKSNLYIENLNSKNIKPRFILVLLRELLAKMVVMMIVTMILAMMILMKMTMRKMMTILNDDGNDDGNRDGNHDGDDSSN